MYREVVLVVSYFWTVLSISPTKLLIVSFDGFRYDYVNKTSTPNIFNLRQKSAYADYMKNVFPTKTFPNHYSLATGVYVEDHGVIDSEVQDHGVKVTYSQRLFEYNPSILPIWIHNQKHGGVSGSMMWLGGEFKYQNSMAKFQQSFSETIAWERKIATVISWLKDTKTPANLAMMYFNQPDNSAHHFGTNSIAVRTQINTVDAIVKHLDQKLKESNLNVNVFVLSDHGMVDVPFANIIDLSVAGNKQLYEVRNFYTTIGTTPMLQVIPVKGKTGEVYEAFSKVAKVKSNFKVYTKSKLPPAWRLLNNERVPEILVVADLGYGFHDLLEWTPKPVPGSVLGVHGYDTNYAEMRPFFMAWGPNVKKNFKIPPFDSVDLYVLWCKLLGIPPGKNNGVLGHVKDMLST